MSGSSPEPPKYLREGDKPGKVLSVCCQSDPSNQDLLQVCCTIVLNEPNALPGEFGDFEAESKVCAGPGGLCRHLYADAFGEPSWVFIRLPRTEVFAPLRWAGEKIAYLTVIPMSGTARSTPSPPRGESRILNSNGRKHPAQEGDEEGDKPLTLSTLLAALKQNREEIVAQVREDSTFSPIEW